MDTTKRQLFFSHTWKNDNLNRDNHARVCELAKKLETCGWSVWIDENNLYGNIDAAMVNGIDNAEVVMVCLTDTYCRKVHETANDPRKRDNCLKEWTYANARNKLMIPIVMEPCLLDMNKWPPGVVSLYFGSTLYMDGSEGNLNNCANEVDILLKKYGLSPHINTQLENNKILLQKKILSKLHEESWRNSKDDDSWRHSRVDDSQRNSKDDESQRNSKVDESKRNPNDELSRNYDNESQKNLFNIKKNISFRFKLMNFLIKKKRIHPAKASIIPHIINNNLEQKQTETIYSKNNYFTKIHQKWKTTGQIQTVSI